MKQKTLFIILFIIGSFHVKAQNNSIEFDGLDDRILINGSSTYNSANALTVEAWINANAWKSGIFEGTIVGKDDGNTAGYALRCGSNGSLDFVVGTTAGWTNVSSAPIMPATSWNHVAAVMDNGTISIYINGVLVGSKSSTAISTTTNNVYIGESAGFPGRVFDGRIDEVRIWDVARTQNEIQTNMAVDLPTNTPNLLSYFKMDVINGGTTTPDFNTSGNLGTLENFAGTPIKSGYEITTLDIAVDAIQAPDLINVFNEHNKVKATFKNIGVDTIKTFDVSYSIDGGVTKKTDNVTQTINPGDSYDHIFSEILPKATNTFSLTIIAELSGDNNSSNDTLVSQYVKPANANSLEIPVFTKEHHSFGAEGQTHFAGITLPDDNLNYSRIIMEISVSCPALGCDAWDQPAKISVKKDGQTYEVARYITPYGKACGPWTVDVTDFKTILKGYTEFESFIQVWGTSGWLLDVKLIYEADPVTNPYQNLTGLWATDNWIYGDPGKVSYDLPAQTVPVSSDVKELEMRMTITGHGQGNTNNAAEFSQFTHQVTANGANVNSHVLWNSDCAQNLCSNQAGTWLLDRAGWCPGEAVDPYHVNLTSNVVNNSITVDYVLQNYTNLLNTGYNSGGHTEPHYKIHAYLVEKSDKYISPDALTDLAAIEITSPTNVTLSSTSAVKVMLSNHGSTAIVDPELTLMINGTQSAVETATGTIAPGASLEYTFNYQAGFNVSTVYDIAVIIDATDDETVSNDVASRIVDANAVGIKDVETENNINLFPNPSTGDFIIKGKELNGKTTIRILTLTGKEVYYSTKIASGQIKIEEEFAPGTYLIEINANENIVRKKFTIL